MSGWVVVAGLGPGNAGLITPDVTAALADATDVVGYFPYVARVAPREGLRLHGSDNRVELDRAALALQMAAAGRLEAAYVVEYATMPNQRVLRLADLADDVTPYFSIVLVHGQGRRP